MKAFGKATLVLSALAIVAAACAQSNGPKGFSARLGAQFARGGDSNLAFGLDYKLNKVSVGNYGEENPSYVGLSVDYYGRSGYYNIPLAVTYNVRATQLVFSAGLGIDIYRFGSYKSGFGGQLGVQYEIGQSNSANPLFVGAKYFFANESDLSGLGIYAGYRF
jgi:hypothetical protein